MMRRFGWIVVLLGITTLGTAGAMDDAPRRATRPAEVAPDFGGCVYECDTTGVRYRVRSQCTAVCTGFCEPIC